MTTRHSGYLVTLAEPVRGEGEDQATINAIKQIKGVISVEPMVDEFNTAMARQQVKHSMGYALIEAVHQIVRDA